MASEIKDLHRKIEVSAVRDIVVTTTVQADGSYTRAIRILGEPIVNGAPLEILEIVLVASERERLHIDAPAQIF